MKSFTNIAPSCLALLLGCSAAAAQTVYRCGNSYSQTPCADARVVKTDDPRTEAQRTSAQQALVQDKALAREMEASRHKDETLALARAKAEQAALARTAAAHDKANTKKSKEPKAGKKSNGLRSVKVQPPGVFTATVEAPTPPKAQPKRGKP